MAGAALSVFCRGRVQSFWNLQRPVCLCGVCLQFAAVGVDVRAHLPDWPPHVRSQRGDDFGMDLGAGSAGNVLGNALGVGDSSVDPSAHVVGLDHAHARRGGGDSLLVVVWLSLGSCRPDQPQPAVVFPYLSRIRYGAEEAAARLGVRGA